MPTTSTDRKPKREPLDEPLHIRLPKLAMRKLRAKAKAAGLPLTTLVRMKLIETAKAALL